MTAEVYRAPMRSRRDAVALGPTVARARALGVCGLGGVLDPRPDDLDAAIALAAEQYDDRLARRIARFGAVPLDSLVWTRDEDGLFWLGRLTGDWRYDGSAEAAAVDLVHVRDCTWLDRPVLPALTPAAVLATFRRGGRNFQRIHDAAVADESRRLWPN